MQEAYCPPCSKYSLCCPNWVPPPRQGTPPARVPPRPGYPPPPEPGRVPPPPGWTWQGPPRLPHGILGNVAKHYGIRVPPCEQTNKVKLLPSCCTTYAGGNKQKVCSNCSLDLVCKEFDYN